jgi:hypothetical protein
MLGLFTKAMGVAAVHFDLADGNHRGSNAESS